MAVIVDLFIMVIHLFMGGAIKNGIYALNAERFVNTKTNS